MRALSNYAELVKQACQSGANAIICGAGLPFDLPDLTEPYPDVALIPILSEERGVRAVIKRWSRKGRAPDAIVIEHPRYAGGHLGAPRIEDVPVYLDGVGTVRALNNVTVRGFWG